jgi:PAS domain S-box-containing protein
VDDDFRTLFDFLPIGAYRSTPDGRMLRSNPALVRLNGCDSAEELHALVHDIGTEWYVDPERRAEFKRLLEHDGRVVGFVSEIRRQKTRERIWVRENAHVLRHPDGRVRCYEGTVEEITAEVQAQQALAESRRELARIIDLLPGVIYKTRWTADGRSRQVRFVSAKLRELFGIEPGLATGRPDVSSELRHPEDAPWVDEAVRAALDGNTALDIEYRALRPDGRPCWVRMTSVPAPDEDGCKVRVGMLFDVTERHLAAQALAEQGEVWKRAMESSGDAVWDWDLERGVETMSGNVAGLYGYEAGELPSSPDTMDALTHPDDVPGMRQAREEHFAQRSRVYLHEHRIRCKDGRWKWVLSRGIVIRRGPDGRPLRMIGTHTDIDAAKRSEELRHERDRAAASDRAKSEFLSRVSHELRTPLNAVLGFAQLLARPDAAMAKVQAQWVGHILASGRHLLALVDDVLDLSAAESGRLRLAPEPVDLQALVAEVLAMTAHDAATAGVRLPSPVGPDGMGGPGGGPPVLAWGDRTRCRQIVANLVSNAVKYNRPGGAVQVRMWAEAGLACLTVQDDGPGIALALRERLFEPFERLEAAQGPVRGTGLGLALSRQLALSMAGSLALTSPPGAGACFELRLPAATGDQRDAATVRLGTPNSPPP